jgi:hypothetical protein
MEYVDWAMAHDFGVVDINVPPYITHDDDPEVGARVEELTDLGLEKQTEFVVTYLWDNYMQFFDDDVDIWLVGIGRAYLGIRALLLNRGESFFFGSRHHFPGAARSPPSDTFWNTRLTTMPPQTAAQRSVESSVSSHRRCGPSSPRRTTSLRRGTTKILGCICRQLIRVFRMKSTAR